MESLAVAGKQLDGFGGLQGGDEIDDGPRTPMVSQVSSMPARVSGALRRQARQAVSPGRTVMVRP